MITDFLVSFFAVGLAELGDKTQLSVILLSSRTKKHLPLLAGVVLAFLVVDGVAVAAGSWVTSILPENSLKIICSVVFLVFGLLLLRQSKSDSAEEVSFKNPFAAGFMLIFLTEWGDKTQIASALLSVEYNPVMVLFGSLTALALLSALAVYVGKKVSEKVDRRLVSKLSGLLFIALGLVSLIL
jgi:putative Ca2+/H+ antiporter (TMEM165/GDT1 family)